MMGSISRRAVLLCGLLGTGAATCAAQAYTPPPPPLTTLPPCPADKDAKKRAKRKDCDPTVYPSETVETKGKKAADVQIPAVAPPAGGTAADKFPFPGEQPASTSAAKKFPYPGSDGGEAAPAAASDPASTPKANDDPAGKTYRYPGEDTRNVPHDPAAEKKATDSPAGKAFPYPGEATPNAPTDAGAAPKGDDSSSSSSSSSSSDNDVAGSTGNGSKSAASKNPDDDDEDQPKLKDKGSEGKRSKKVVKPQTDTERVDEDLSVAKFYGQSGNSMGAYLRAKDAVKTQPEYPEGHFVLGEAAKRLNKRDEAAAEFQTYLKLSPDGQQAKAAEKALDDLK